MAAASAGASSSAHETISAACFAPSSAASSLPAASSGSASAVSGLRRDALHGAAQDRADDDKAGAEAHPEHHRRDDGDDWQGIRITPLRGRSAGLCDDHHHNRSEQYEAAEDGPGEDLHGADTDSENMVGNVHGVLR